MNTIYFILAFGGAAVFFCWCAYTILKAIKRQK
jgi:hypothetical protein